MRIQTGIILAAMIGFSGQAIALSGNEYRGLSPEQYLLWTVGVADGILTEQLFA